MGDPKNMKELVEAFKAEVRKNMEDSKYIYGKKSLSFYLGGMPISTIKDLEKCGIIKKRKLGKNCVYLKSEIDQAAILTNSTD